MRSSDADSRLHTCFSSNVTDAIVGLRDQFAVPSSPIEIVGVHQSADVAVFLL